ncbi:Conserved_hypothetical protein [Hexamita inflata]|uniref:Uncharacterized protein n=1 Tax=Hexamita inflata TaxID=28002 RepID=A0AA86TSL4_9EUKA|nr:Conserved hypothetical protein [Hexamita inflata]
MANRVVDVKMDMIQTNGQFDLNKFFELSFYEGTPLNRFVDDMEVDWMEIAKKIGRSPEECKSQYQYLLDCLFEKQQFTRTDRETLYRVITGAKTYNLKDSTQSVPEETLKEIQRLYFPEYSTEVVKIEILSALENFKLFIQENRPE